MHLYFVHRVGVFGQRRFLKVCFLFSIKPKAQTMKTWPIKQANLVLLKRCSSVKTRVPCSTQSSPESHDLPVSAVLRSTRLRLCRQARSPFICQSSPCRGLLACVSAGKPGVP